MKLVHVLFVATCAWLVNGCTTPRFRDDARVLAVSGPLQAWSERQGVAAKQAVFPEASFQPGSAPSGRVEFYLADDPDLQAAHGIVKVRFMPQGWETTDPVITWVRLFDAAGHLIAEAHPCDTAHEGKDMISRMRCGEPWNRDAFFDLPKRATAEAVQVEIFLDGFVRKCAGR